MSIVFLVIIGIAAGFLATRIMRLETGLVETVAIGIGGAVIGGLILRALLSMMGMMSGLVGAVLGALVLIWVWQRYFARKP